MIVTFGGIGGAIGFSAFTVLGYYAITNASALTLAPSERRWPRALALFGLAGCLALAVSLPGTVLVGGAVLFAVAGIGYAGGHAVARR